jgi:hypothetical protein
MALLNISWPSPPSSLTVIKNPPHSNAAKVFNWLP